MTPPKEVYVAVFFLFPAFVLRQTCRLQAVALCHADKRVVSTTLTFRCKNTFGKVTSQPCGYLKIVDALWPITIEYSLGSRHQTSLLCSFCRMIHALSLSEAVHCLWIIDDFYISSNLSLKLEWQWDSLVTDSQLRRRHATDSIQPALQAAMLSRTLLTSDTLHSDCFVFQSSKTTFFLQH